MWSERVVCLCGRVYFPEYQRKDVPTCPSCNREVDDSLGRPLPGSKPCDVCGNDDPGKFLRTTAGFYVCTNVEESHSVPCLTTLR